jgi:hypothetical protein
VTKIGQKFIFHPREAHILARLDIIVLYTVVEVLKILNFDAKPKGDSLRF